MATIERGTLVIVVGLPFPTAAGQSWCRSHWTVSAWRPGHSQGEPRVRGLQRIRWHAPRQRLRVRALPPRHPLSLGFPADDQRLGPDPAQQQRRPRLRGHLPARQPDPQGKQGGGHPPADDQPPPHPLPAPRAARADRGPELQPLPGRAQPGARLRRWLSRHLRGPWLPQPRPDGPEGAGRDRW